ncbi:MAG: hypothetical protein HGA98_05890 [Deltaproteobacteria bacterium]|nr:hypothetical protein [Deltaproteobacteria bacterium]
MDDRATATPLRFEPRGLPTGIGSVPLADPEAAVAFVLSRLPEIPFWPQLPRRTPLEGMTLQYVSGFPGLRDAGAGRDPFVDTGPDGQAELEPFYAAVLGDDPVYFALPEERAQGFYAFERALAAPPSPAPRYLKGHVTGPVTLASSLKGADGRELLYDDTFREVVGEFVAACVRWQLRRLSALGAPVLLFLDEPVMEVYGSAYSAALTGELVESLWRPSLDSIRAQGALSGIHCCGNTDWGFLFSSGTDVVNFDAYHFLDRLLLYPEAAGRFMENGGALAWGIVPTSKEAWGETVDGLTGRLEEGFGRLAAAGVDAALLRRQCLLTPSCGMGSLEPELAEHVLTLLGGVSARIRS